MRHAGMQQEFLAYLRRQVSGLFPLLRSEASLFAEGRMEERGPVFALFSLDDGSSSGRVETFFPKVPTRETAAQEIPREMQARSARMAALARFDPGEECAHDLAVEGVSQHAILIACIHI